MAFVHKYMTKIESNNQGLDIMKLQSMSNHKLYQKLYVLLEVEMKVSKILLSIILVHQNIFHNYRNKIFLLGIYIFILSFKKSKRKAIIEEN